MLAFRSHPPTLMYHAGSFVSFSKIYPRKLRMDSDKEEIPPLLVDTKAGVQDPEDIPMVRVPITIVTGTKSLRTLES